MALNLQISDAAANAAVNALVALANGGSIKIYTARSPPMPTTAITSQTLLATFILATAFGNAVAGVATANAISSAAAVASGTATWFRVFKSDGTSVVFDGTVGTSGCDLNMNSNVISSGATVAIPRSPIPQRSWTVGRSCVGALPRSSVPSPRKWEGVSMPIAAVQTAKGSKTQQHYSVDSHPTRPHDGRESACCRCGRAYFYPLGVSFSVSDNACNTWHSTIIIPVARATVRSGMPTISLAAVHTHHRDAIRFAVWQLLDRGHRVSWLDASADPYDQSSTGQEAYSDTRESGSPLPPPPKLTN